MSSQDEKLDTAGAPSKDAKAFIKDHERKIKRRFFSVRFGFTFILVVCIAVIWTGLLSPLIISYFVQPSTSDLNRTYYDQLNQLFNGSNPNLTCNNTGSVLNATCPPLYVFSCPKCVPICGVWHPFGENYFLAFRAIAISISIIDLLFATVGAIIFVRVPGSLHFPKVIYFFLFISLIILSTILTIASIMGPHRFFCDLRNEDYKTVAASPSLLVTILGFVSHYSYVSFDVCFLVAAFNIFIIIYFPHWQVFKAVNQKRVLVSVEFIACICLPIALPIIHLSITRQYSFIRLPLLPFPLGDPLTPFLLVLGPLLLFTGVALTLIALSIYRVKILKYIIYKELVNFKSYEIRHIMFAIQVWFTVTFIFIEISSSLANTWISELLLDEFWSCTTLQFNPHFLSNQTLAPSECPASYKAFMHPIFSLLADATTGISSVEILVILTTRDTYEAWRNSCQRVFHRLNAMSQHTVSLGHTATRN